MSPAKVTGYLRHDVSLPCKFIPGPENDIVAQVQWGFKETEQNETVILVSRHQLEVNIPDTFLKGKVKIQEQSLIISDLEERDAGWYACKISAFPGGSFEASIQLIVQGKRYLQISELLTADCAPSGEDCANNEAIVSCFFNQSWCRYHRARFLLL